MVDFGKLRCDEVTGKSLSDRRLSLAPEFQRGLRVGRKPPDGGGHGGNIPGRHADAARRRPPRCSTTVGNDNRRALGEGLETENAEGLLPAGRKDERPGSAQLGAEILRSEPTPTLGSNELSFEGTRPGDGQWQGAIRLVPRAPSIENSLVLHQTSTHEKARPGVGPSGADLDPRGHDPCSSNANRGELIRHVGGQHHHLGALKCLESPPGEPEGRSTIVLIGKTVTADPITHLHRTHRAIDQRLSLSGAEHPVVLNRDNGPSGLHRHPQSDRIHDVLDVDDFGLAEQTGEGLQFPGGFHSGGQTTNPAEVDRIRDRHSALVPPEGDGHAVAGLDRGTNNLRKMLIGTAAIAQPIGQVEKSHSAFFEIG